jgi:hypothetical protein
MEGRALMRVGVLLQRYRAEHHLTVGELADRMGLPQDDVWAVLDDRSARESGNGPRAEELDVQVLIDAMDDLFET